MLLSLYNFLYLYKLGYLPEGNIEFENKLFIKQTEMRNNILTLLTFISLSFTATAQYSEAERPMSMGMKNSLSLSVNDLKTSKVEDIWQDYVKQYDGKTKKDKKMKEYVTDAAKVYYIPGLSTINIYARFEERGKTTTEAIIFFLDGDRFLSTSYNADQMKAANEFVRQFDIAIQKYKTNQLLEAEQKKLKGLESDLKKLVRDNESLHKDIEGYKDKIAKAETAISKNNGDQEKTASMIMEQNKVIEKVKTDLNALK